MTDTGGTIIRFWGGLRTIGGNIASVQYEDSRVIFDFGFDYSPASEILDGRVRERPFKRVTDYLRLGMLPPIDGVYSRESGPLPNLLYAEESPLQTEVFISHLHLDHMGAMGLVAPIIPVNLSADANDLYMALTEVGEGVPGNREYRGNPYNSPITVGAIKATPLRVDHDVHGACAYRIETPDGCIVYSGDLRLHGSHPEWTQSFVDQSRGTDLLLMETTMLSWPDELSEEEETREFKISTERDIAPRVTETLLNSKGLAIFNIYHRNIDRIVAMADAAREANRKLVFEPETALLALRLTPMKDFLVYRSEHGDEASWKRTIFDTFSTVNSDQINSRPQSFFIQNTYENMLELLDLDTSAGVYIHSNGVPLGSFDPAWDRLHLLLDKLGIEFEFIGSTGHATPDQLNHIVDGISPGTLIPWHGYHPERLHNEAGKRLLPEYGVSYRMKNGEVNVLQGS